MEDRSNKTIICSVLFLDIVEYSKKSVAGQISLKDRFNTYLSEAIHDVPVNDRIILDTGDGAAVNFLGDVESALTAALRLRESLLGEDPQVEPKLLVRIGINLGPVRLVRDINGQPNIVGDGINVAQRVMAFADASQILVSRSYFDAVSRLSPEYSGMFHYQGSRTDKHVREHEVYAIGYPGDRPDVPATTQPEISGETTPEAVATPKRFALYAAMGVVLALGAALLLLPKKEQQPAETVETMPQPASAVPVVAASNVQAPVQSSAQEKVQKPIQEKAEKPVQAEPAKPARQSQTKRESAEKKPATPAPRAVESHAPSRDAQPGRAQTSKSASESAPEQEVSVTIGCKDDTQLFVDGTARGRIASGSMTIAVKPGRHKVILTHPGFGIYAEEVSVEPGKSVRIRPKVCN